MSDVQDRIEARKVAKERLREQLAGLNLDGPHEFSTSGGFDPISSMFGGRDKYAICLLCGSVVMLNDPEENAEGVTIERSVRIHTAWHDEVSA